MTRPNFFIIGAPKSGTTAMAGYLGDHPGIHFCEPKEPCFFATDFPGQRLAESEEDYLALFADGAGEEAAVGEGSVWYLYSEEALANIRAFDPDARIIVMLRNPVEQVYSMHQELYHRRYEAEADFTRAWALQERRRRGQDIPKYCKEAAFLQYGRIASYAAQVERLFQTFPRAQVRIVIFDDFKKDAGATYRALLAFLGVPDDGRAEFRPALESRRHRLHWLGTFLINQPAWLVRVKSGIKRALGIERLGVREMVAQYNTVVEKRAPLPPAFTEELKDYFRADVEKLSQLLDRDLSGWCR